jgi:aminobenzoyl-glutamate transport protein
MLRISLSKVIRLSLQNGLLFDIHNINNGVVLRNANPSTQIETKSNNGWFSRFLATVEWYDRRPHPITFFALLAIFIVMLSGIVGYFAASVADPRHLDAMGWAPDAMMQ